MGRWDAGWRGVLSGLAPGGGRGYIAFGRLTGPGRHQRADWVPGLGSAVAVRLRILRFSRGRLRFSRCARVALDAFAQLAPRLEPGRVPRGKRHRRPGPGARPIRARRRRSEKPPMPRISMRPPRARHRAIWSSIVFTASSMSRSTSCEFFRAMR